MVFRLTEHQCQERLQNLIGSLPRAKFFVDGGNKNGEMLMNPCSPVELVQSLPSLHPFGAVFF